VSHWYSSQKTGTLKIFAFSDPSGLPINGDAELAKIEFGVAGRAGDKSAIDIQGITGNSDVEPIESKWMDSEVTVIGNSQIIIYQNCIIFQEFLRHRLTLINTDLK